MKDLIYEILRENLQIEVKILEDIRSYTTFKVGGKVKYLCKISDINKFPDVIKIAKEHHLKFIVIGGGSNLYFTDEIYEGIVILNRCNKFEIKGREIECESGALIEDIIKECVQKGIAGLEFMAGIPGTIGGAVCGNAGAFGDSIGNYIKSALIIDEKLVLKTVNKEFFNFSYRTSNILDSEKVILKVTLELKEGEREEIIRKVEEYKKIRESKIPYDVPSAGSFFKNVLLSKDTSKRTSAGELIDKAGYKGFRIGDAQVSVKHGNFIINVGNATSKDVLMLAEKLKKVVYDKFGIMLDEEVRYIS